MSRIDTPAPLWFCRKSWILGDDRCADLVDLSHYCPVPVVWPISMRLICRSGVDPERPFWDGTGPGLSVHPSINVGGSAEASTFDFS